MLSNRLVVRHIVNEHAGSSITVSLGNSSTIAIRLRCRAGDNLLELSRSIGQVDGRGTTGDQISQLLADEHLDLLSNVRGLVVLQLHSQSQGGDYGDRGRSASAHILDSVPAIFGAADLIVLSLMRQLELVEDLQATRLVANRFEHHVFDNDVFLIFYYYIVDSTFPCRTA